MARDAACGMWTSGSPPKRVTLVMDTRGIDAVNPGRNTGRKALNRHHERQSMEQANTGSILGRGTKFILEMVPTDNTHRKKLVLQECCNL